MIRSLPSGAALRSWQPALILPLALAALAAVSRWVAAPPGPPGRALALPAMVVLAAVAAVYAPQAMRRGDGGIGLGAAALAPAALGLGPAAATSVAGVAYLLRELARARLTARSPREELGLPRLLTRLGQVLLAVLVATCAWAWWPGAGLAAGLAAVALYLALLAGLDLGLARLSGCTVDRSALAVCLGLELTGCLIGLPIAAVVAASGWRVALPLLTAAALLALEAARVGWLRETAERRVRELRQITQAGHRIAFRNPDLLGLAEQIYLECRQVVESEWFQFELLAEEIGGRRSWCAGPEGGVREGEPDPPELPPTLPGIHRRARWQMIEREFGEEDELVARLRLWCDPRRLNQESLELLDSLLPQMVSSVHRAVLDRVAKRDPLTDLPDRRAFDSHLERVFRNCRRDGRSMAVILCDVDNFKRINDLNGHAVGDRALLVVSRLMESQSREEDFCCRLGGDEFAVVLEGADGKLALAIAERIRQAVARRRRSDFTTRIPLRLTAGVAAFPELPVGRATDLVELADAAMYEAKRHGRNRCLLHLGRTRFQTPGGDVLGDPGTSEIEPPTLFA